MCTRCGKDITAPVSSSLSTYGVGASGELIKTNAVSIRGRSLHYTDQQLLEKAREHTRELIAARKLVLILDLDHTLVHATTDPRAERLKDVYSFTIPPHNNRHFIKPRVGIDRLLQRLKDRYELHLYTMGVRPYAEA